MPLLEPKYDLEDNILKVFQKKNKIEKEKIAAPLFYRLHGLFRGRVGRPRNSVVHVTEERQFLQGDLEKSYFLRKMSFR